MKIRPVGAELFHADGRTDGQTDMTKLIVAFGKFANAPKTVYLNFNQYTVYSALFAYSMGSKHVGCRPSGVLVFVPKLLWLLEWYLRIHTASQTVLFLQQALFFNLMSFVITFVMNQM
jgi:hypothetical protein